MNIKIHNFQPAIFLGVFLTSILLIGCGLDNGTSSNLDFSTVPWNDKIVYGKVIDDRDGQIYKTVTIGNQVWFAQNLNFKQNSGSDSGACYYGDPEYCLKFGKLYTWAAMADTTPNFNTDSLSDSITLQGICPSGWRIPSETDWDSLFSFIGTDTVGKLKSSYGWSYNGNGIDQYGFRALPGGRRVWDGSFTSLNDFGYFWTSTQYAKYGAYTFYFDNGIGSHHMNGDVKSSGYSVRCIQAKTQ